MLLNAERGTYSIRFFSYPSLVEFYDGNGRIVYTRKLNGQTSDIDINFPVPGTYYSNIDFMVTNVKDLQTSGYNIELPQAERNSFDLLVSSGRNIVIKNDPSMTDTPACIYHATGLILTGQEFNNLPQQFKLFILLHELGHMWYTTEWKCDLFALKNYLMMGYNASNGFYALSQILRTNPDNLQRILFIYKNIQK